TARIARRLLRLSLMDFSQGKRFALALLQIFRVPAASSPAGKEMEPPQNIEPAQNNQIHSRWRRYGKVFIVIGGVAGAAAGSILIILPYICAAPLIFFGTGLLGVLGLRIHGLFLRPVNFKLIYEPSARGTPTKWLRKAAGSFGWRRYALAAAYLGGMIQQGYAQTKTPFDISQLEQDQASYLHQAAENEKEGKLHPSAENTRQAAAIGLHLRVV